MKSSNKKPSSLLDEGAPAVQLSSRQLLVAVITLLVAACLLFVAGIVVGQFRASGDQSRKETKYVPAPAPEPERTEWETAREGEGTQTSPRRDMFDKVPDETEPRQFSIPAPPPRTETPETSPEADKLEPPSEPTTRTSSEEPPGESAAAAQPEAADEPEAEA